MKQKINDGVYLVANPSIPLKILCSKIEQALAGGVCVVQLWNNWQSSDDKIFIINKIHQLTATYNVPLILNELYDYIEAGNFEGIHFDKPHPKIKEFQSARPDLIWGLTCSNDFSNIGWANENDMDYISFCSMFHSKTSNSCALVQPDIIKKVKEIFAKPVFLAGGINHQTLPLLKDFTFNGIALVSAIMEAENPKTEVEKYTNEIKALRND